MKSIIGWRVAAKASRILMAADVFWFGLSATAGVVLLTTAYVLLDILFPPSLPSYSGSSIFRFPPETIKAPLETNPHLQTCPMLQPPPHFALPLLNFHARHSSNQIPSSHHPQIHSTETHHHIKAADLNPIRMKTAQRCNYIKPGKAIPTSDRSTFFPNRLNPRTSH